MPPPLPSFSPTRTVKHIATTTTAAAAATAAATAATAAAAAAATVHTGDASILTSGRLDGWSLWIVVDYQLVLVLTDIRRQ